MPEGVVGKPLSNTFTLVRLDVARETGDLSPNQDNAFSDERVVQALLLVV
jgi:hypothetical protein